MILPELGDLRGLALLLAEGYANMAEWLPTDAGVIGALLTSLFYLWASEQV